MSGTNEDQRSGPSMLEDLLGKPPLMKGEDEERYWRLHAAIEDELKPATRFDMIWVRELVDKLWEKRRYAQGLASLVESSYVRALAELLELSALPSEEVDLSIGDKDLNQARAYFDRNTSSKRRKELASLLTQYGITEEQIRAKAMELCGPSISALKRFEYRDDKSIRRLHREYERRVARREREKSSSPSEQ